ncbi:MAG: LPS assembly lipoprotein LptE [Rhizobiaceae bacterium]
MSLRERKGPISAFALALGLAMAVSACTVRPLYMKEDPTAAGASAGAAAELASVAVKPVTTRYAQLVRNELIFLLGGGSGEAVNPRYTLDLNVSSQQMSTAVTPASTSDEVNVPTAAIVTLTARYKLTDMTSDKLVASGSRNITSSIDVPRQEYAAMRAESDAQKRAARELAQLLRFAIAQDLAREGKK